MNNHNQGASFQSEINELMRKRKSLETDVLILEEKINIVDSKLKNEGESKKLLSFKKFLATEKEQIKKNKLSRIIKMAEFLQSKIENIRSTKGRGSNTSSKLNSNIFSEFNESQHQDRREKKLQSFPIARPRPHTSADSQQYCAYCRESIISKRPYRNGSVTSFSQKTHSISHLPLCMSMSICKECTAMRDFFLNVNNKNESRIDNSFHKNCTKNNCFAFFKGECNSPCIMDSTDSITSRTNRNNDLIHKSNSTLQYFETFDQPESIKQDNRHENNINSQWQDVLATKNPQELKDMLKKCDSISACSACASLKVHCSSTHGEHKDKIDEIVNSEYLDDEKSLSASVLAMCDSYAVCQCCNHNLRKINMPSPTTSVVEFECLSNENCSKCAGILQDASKRNTMEIEKNSLKLTSNDILSKKSSDSGKEKGSSNALSSVSIKREQGDFTMYHPRRKIYEGIKKEIEFQNRLIFSTEEQLSKIGVLNESDQRLFQLRNMLETQNLKLNHMKKLAKMEEKRPKDDIWWENPAVLVYDF